MGRCSQSHLMRVMRSVPPRGSGWVMGTHHSIRMKVAARTHPLPRGGTDLMTRSQLNCSRNRGRELKSIPIGIRVK